MTKLSKNRGYHVRVPAGRPATKTPPQFGKRLSELRLDRGWTQPELAERLGVSVKAVTYYEREAENPTAKTVARIAKAFEMTPAEFMQGVKLQKRKTKSGPPSRLDTIFEQVAKLPRSKQKLVADMLEGFLGKAS